MERLEQMQRLMGGAEMPAVAAPPSAPVQETRLERIRRWSRDLAAALELLEELPGLLEDELSKMAAHQDALSGGVWKHARGEAEIASRSFEMAGLACRHLAAALGDGDAHHCEAALHCAGEAESLLDEVEERMGRLRREQPLVA